LISFVGIDIALRQAPRDAHQILSGKEEISVNHSSQREKWWVITGSNRGPAD
jgi:hypothetical protein